MCTVLYLYGASLWCLLLPSVLSLRLYQHGLFECNANVTITCELENPPNDVILEIDGLRVAVCSSSKCNVNPTTPVKYVVEHNHTAGVINVTIQYVSTSVEDSVFRCDGDSSFLEIKPYVNVTPKLFIMDVNRGKEYTSVQATTDCSKPPDKLTFKWFRSEENNSTWELIPSSSYEQLNIDNNSFCEPDMHCNGTGKTSIITFPTPAEGNRKAYFVKCDVYLSTTVIVTNKTGDIVWLPGQTTATTPDPGEDNSQLDLGLGLGISLGLLAIIAAFCTILCLIKDPVHDLSVSPPISNGSKMTVKLQFKSRLCSMKTFHVMLNDGKSFTLSKNCAIELTDLNPDSTYIASVFSTVCIFQSCRKSIEFNTIDRPLPPYNVCEEKTLRTGSSVTVNWNRAKGPKHNFVIKYQRTKGLKRDWMFTGVINDTRYTLDGLKPGTSYTLLIHAVNDAGVSEDSETLFVKTRGCPFPPYNICEEKTLRTESSVTLNWNRAKGPKHNFVIKYQRTKGLKRDWMFTGLLNDTRHTLDGLKPGTSYTLLIHAVNDVGCSEDSEPLFVKTRALKPILPEEFRCESVKDNEVVLSWKPFKNIRKQQFILTVYNMSEELPPGQERKDTEICIPYTGKPVMTYTVMELKPSSKYMFEIYTSTGKRLSERSAIASVETADRGEDADGVHSKRKSSKTTSVFLITRT